MPNNISCIIIDDEQDAIELLTDRLGILFKDVLVTATFTGWEEALQAVRSQKPDLILLDISMPGKNAFDLLKLLPNLNSELIFVTAHETFALDAFAFSASGYLLKPVDDAELFAAVNKARERIQNKKLAQKNSVNQSVSDKIGIPNNHGIDYININDILYLESTNKCTKLVTGKGEYISSLNIGRFLHLIDEHSFFQVHRSYIVNLKSILRYESSGLVIMSNKKEIPVSRNVKNDFLSLFNNNF
jgi:two-component system, LytTR family, response regulator